MRLFTPTPLSREQFDRIHLEKDMESLVKFGPSGVSDEAVYINSYFRDRKYYIPFSAVSRIYKRVAMSKGGFTGKGAFASQAYIVVEYDDGEERKALFKREEEVDRMLLHISKKHPEIRTLSLNGERRLEKRRKEEEKRYLKTLSLEAENSIKEIDNEISYLQKREELSIALSAAAKRLRAARLSKKSLKFVATVIVVLGLVSLLYGISSLLENGFSDAIYFTLFGLAAVFLFSGLSVIPTGRNNTRVLEKSLSEAEKALEEYTKAFPSFSVPYYYAHPAVLERIKRVIREGKAEDIDTAFSIMKDELKKIDSSVTVSEEEYEEIVAIKPMFLLRDYN